MACSQKCTCFCSVYMFKDIRVNVMPDIIINVDAIKLD